MIGAVKSGVYPQASIETAPIGGATCVKIFEFLFCRHDRFATRNTSSYQLSNG
jgi:hypothetical protein